MSLVGVVGGMFDPPHVGHVELVRGAIDGLGLERVVVVVAGAPPHRPAPRTSAADRVAMARAAFAAVPAVEVSDIEVRRAASGGGGYMVDTLEALARDLPDDDRLVLVVGSDQALAFTTWHRWRDIVRRWDLAVATRAGVPEQGDDLAAALATIDAVRPGCVRTFAMRPTEMSSSAIRTLIDAGRMDEAARHVPAPVAALLGSVYGVR